MSVTQKSTEVFSGLSVLEVPYGYQLVRNLQQFTFDDPRSVAAIEAKYTSYLENFGVKSLHIHQEVPAEKQLIRMGEFLWELGPMDMERVYPVPEWVVDRMRALERADVPFAWFLWADEKLAYPKVAPAPVVVPVRKYDPAIIGVIPTDFTRKIGLWYLLAAWLK